MSRASPSLAETASDRRDAVGASDAVMGGFVVVHLTRYAVDTAKCCTGDHGNEVGADCTHTGYGATMSKVIHIRDVPNETHEALTAAARSRGMSLSHFLRTELEDLARRDQQQAENLTTIIETRRQITNRPGRGDLLDAIEDGRRR